MKLKSAVRWGLRFSSSYEKTRESKHLQTIFRPRLRRLEGLNIYRCQDKGSTVLLSYIESLSVGPAENRTWAYVLPLQSLVGKQLSNKNNFIPFLQKN